MKAEHRFHGAVTDNIVQYALELVGQVFRAQRSGCAIQMDLSKDILEGTELEGIAPKKVGD